MNDLLITLFSIFFIFFMTTLGASLVFLFKEIPLKLNSIILGFSAGIMFSASIWSLLVPAISSVPTKNLEILPIFIGFLFGGVILSLLSFWTKSELSRKNMRYSRLFWAVTIHNIPEGMAVGVALGSAFCISEVGMISALMLAIGIGIQNLPEGMAVSLPFKVSGRKNIISFGYGIVSGIVEPIAAIIGFVLASFLPILMPFLLAFSAGAMIFVVVQDLIPTSVKDSSDNLGVWAFILGFFIMMLLDVFLG